MNTQKATFCFTNTLKVTIISSIISSQVRSTVINDIP